MGVDVARFGSDKTVFAFRQGRNARVIPFKRYLGDDTMIIANNVDSCGTLQKTHRCFYDRLKSTPISLVETGL
jgi:hypothetical protein